MLRDESKKAKHNTSDLDNQSKQGKNIIEGSSAFSDPCMTLYEYQQCQWKKVNPEM